MADFYLNSANGSPASPYDTWAKAATTLEAIEAVGTMAAGDIVYVDPSHAESTATSVVFPGTLAAPCKIICGTHSAATGITAVSTGGRIAAGTTGVTIAGNIYVYGITFAVTGSGTLSFNFNTTAGIIQEHDHCTFSNENTSATTLLKFGQSGAAEGSRTTLRNCVFRFGNTSQYITCNHSVIIRGATFTLGSSPTWVFYVGQGAVGANLDASGIDFSNLNAAVDLLGENTKSNWSRLRNCKVPASWSGTLQTAGIMVGSHHELLNYSVGTADTNHKFWIENDQGIAKSNDSTDTYPVVLPTGAADEGTNYSMAMASSANVGYPSSIYRGPPLVRRCAAGTYDFQINFCHDGASAFTDKEVWAEVEYRATSGSPVSTFYTSCPDFVTAAAANAASGVSSWDGDSGTGPNGSSSWNQLAVYLPTLTVAENSYLIVTICMGIASKTIFVDPTIRDQ